MPSGHAPRRQAGPAFSKISGAASRQSRGMAHASARISHCARLQQRSSKKCKSSRAFIVTSRRVAAAPRAVKPASASKVTDLYFAGFREEYRAGGAMPVGSRKAAPVCDKWPDTGWWLSTNSNKRHNKKCENYRKTRGYPCRKDEGSPCGKCGG